MVSSAAVDYLTKPNTKHEKIPFDVLLKLSNRLTYKNNLVYGCCPWLLPEEEGNSLLL